MKFISNYIQRRQMGDKLAAHYGLRRRWFGLEPNEFLARRIIAAAKLRAFQK